MRVSEILDRGRDQGPPTPQTDADAPSRGAGNPAIPQGYGSLGGTGGLYYYQYGQTTVATQTYHNTYGNVFSVWVAQ